MLDRLAKLESHYDVVVIGGGINGAGVARDAALRGFRVLLLEQNDFGSGSSSRSSKLVHGGLRYLEHGQLRLVWEACHERQTLLRLAPHLVRPLPFVFPVFDDSRVDALRLRIGMWLYDFMAAFRNVQRHRMLDVGKPKEWLAALRSDGLRAAALYYDAIMDDARLVLANVLGARDAGALTLNHVAVQRPIVEDDGVCGVEARDAISGRAFSVRARSVVLCAGAWTNRFLGQTSAASTPVAPTRGTHLVIPRITENAFTLAAGRDGRVFFVLPWLGLNLVGTTDVASDEDVDRVTPTEDEVSYLLEETNRFFPQARLARADVVAAFAGLRPLQRSDGDESARSREHSILEPIQKLLCVIGGKYTTYRVVAEEVVDRLAARLGRRQGCSTARRTLPGGDVAWSARDHWDESGAFREAVALAARGSGLPKDLVRRLYARHGSRAPGILDLLVANARHATPLCSHHPHRAAEVVFAIRHEMALRMDDWFVRRSRMAFGVCHGIDALETVADLFAAELGWSDDRRAEEIESARAQLDSIALSPSPASSRSS